MISDSQVERAIEFLKNTDEEAGFLEAKIYSLEKHEKIVLAEEEMKADGKSIKDRENAARLSDEYARWRIMIDDAKEKYNVMRNRRITAHAVVNGYKSQSYSRNLGNI